MIPSVFLPWHPISKGNLQLFHHPTELGGNWLDKSKKVVAVLGFNKDASPVQIIKKSIKEIKGKTPSLPKLAESIDDKLQLNQLYKIFNFDTHLLIFLSCIG